MFNTLASYLLGNNNNDNTTNNLHNQNPDFSNDVRNNIVAVPDEDEDWLLVVDKDGITNLND